MMVDRSTPVLVESFSPPLHLLLLSLKEVLVLIPLSCTSWPCPSCPQLITERFRMLLEVDMAASAGLGEETNLGSCLLLGSELRVGLGFKTTAEKLHS